MVGHGLGGKKRAGIDVWSLQNLRKELASWFIRGLGIPFVLGPPSREGPADFTWQLQLKRRKLITFWEKPARQWKL